MFSRLFFGTLLFLGLLFTSVRPAVAQQGGKIVKVHPSLGIKLTRAERDQYGLFPEIKGFQWATFWLLPDSTYRVQIAYLKGGELHTQIKTLTPQEFRQKYFEPIDRVIRPLEKFRIRGVEVTLETGEAEPLIGKLMGVENDSLICYTAPTRIHKINLAEVQQVTLIKRANWKPVIYGTLGAAAIMGTIGLASGDDPPGWFSMTAEEKALAGVTIAVGVGIFVGTFYNTVKSVDVEVPLEGKSVQVKRLYVKQIVEGTYAVPRKLAGSLSGIFMQVPDAGFRPGAEGTARFYYKPRVSIDLFYGILTPSGEETSRKVLQDDQYAYREEVTHTSHRWHYWGIGTTVRPAGRRRFIPFLSWGLHFLTRVTTTKGTNKQTIYDYPQPGENEYQEYSFQSKESELWGFLNLAGGVRTQLMPHLLLEGIIGIAFSQPSYPYFKLGLQIH